MKIVIVMFKRMVVVSVIKIRSNVVGDSKEMLFYIVVSFDSFVCKILLMFGFVGVLVFLVDRFVFVIVV